LNETQASPPAQPLENATEPIFTTRFAHELQLVRDSLESHAIPYSSVAHDAWSQRGSAELASQDSPPEVRWTILVPLSASHRASTLIAALPVSSDRGIEHGLTPRELRRGEFTLVFVVFALLLALLVFGFVVRFH
jgi:hypothetical protein